MAMGEGEYAMYINKIKQIREENGMTLEKLASLAGISQGYLCHLERGKRKNPSIEVMSNISNALGKSITEVFFE